MPKTKSKPRGKQVRKKKGWRTASTSDKYELYELSVQEAESECDLIDQAWSELRTRAARTIREDFCGTALVCREWVRRRADNTAIGVDLDPEVLSWARSRLDDKLTDEQRSRVKLLEHDVRTVDTDPVDSILAMNFSYYLFKKRDELREYFKCVHGDLVEDGLFLLDAYGGSESFEEMKEDRDLDGFTYVWDQNRYDPITGSATNYIHFKFPDGTKMKKAFHYEWRLWTLPEIQEVLLEAGFREVKVFWEGTDEETDEGDGEWAIAEHGEACPGWVAYLAALK